MLQKKKTHNFWFVLFSLTRYCCCLLFFSAMYLLFIMKHFTSRVGWLAGWLIIKGCINNVQLHLTKKCNNKKTTTTTTTSAGTQGVFPLRWLGWCFSDCLLTSPELNRGSPRVQQRHKESLARTFLCVCLGSGVTSTNRGDDWHWLADRETSVSQRTHVVIAAEKERERVGKDRIYWRRKEWIRIKVKVGNRLTFGPC